MEVDYKVSFQYDQFDAFLKYLVKTLSGHVKIWVGMYMERSGIGI